MIGVCAYNEENNIARLLQNLISEQNIPKESKILVVCSGCTDKTPQIVASFQKKDSRIKPLIENVRRGKSNALNKIFKVAKAEADILILVNADALPEKGSINRLLSKFTAPDVGAVFAQPVPLKNSDSSCYGVTRLDMAFTPYNLNVCDAQTVGRTLRNTHCIPSGNPGKHCNRRAVHRKRHPKKSQEHTLRS